MPAYELPGMASLTAFMSSGVIFSEVVNFPKSCLVPATQNVRSKSIQKTSEKSKKTFCDIFTLWGSQIPKVV